MVFDVVFLDQTTDDHPVTVLEHDGRFHFCGPFLWQPLVVNDTVRYLRFDRHQDLIVIGDGRCDPQDDSGVKELDLLQRARLCRRRYKVPQPLADLNAGFLAVDHQGLR